MKNVVIIGAGPAGLTAAYELLKLGDKYNVVVLEESDCVGGISRTIKTGGNRMDIGGHRFFSKSDEVMNWWQSRMPLQSSPSFDDEILDRYKPLDPNGANPQTTDRVMLIRDRVSRIYYKDKFFDYPVSLKPSTLINMGFLTTIKAGFSYIAASINKRKEVSLEDFYINRFGKVLYGMFFEDYTEKLWGRHPSEISADWGAQRVKGLSIKALIKNIFSKMLKSKDVETSLIEQFWYPKYGPGQLWEEVAHDIEFLGGKIVFNCKVKNLHKTDDKIDYLVCDFGGRKAKIEADYVLSSMPLSELVTGIKGDAVPKEVFATASGLPYRDFVTVGLLVDKLNLKNKTKFKTLGNIVPDCWIYVQDKGVKLGRIQIFNNWSPYMVSDPENKVWIGLEYFCKENDAFWNLNDQELVSFASAELVKMGIIFENSVLHSHCERIKKAYPAYFDTYSNIDCVIDYINKIDNLYCIGRNGQHRYNNMDHSMLTAMRAVEIINNNIKDKSSVWNVNIEKEYHEKK